VLLPAEEGRHHFKRVHLLSARSTDGLRRQVCTFPVPSLYLPCTFPVPSLYLPCARRTGCADRLGRSSASTGR
jgi:hypothetical protein